MVYNQIPAESGAARNVIELARGREQRIEAAAYIATLTGELSAIARRNGLHTLEYLLDMAKLEAEQVSRLNGGQAN